MLAQICARVHGNVLHDAATRRVVTPILMDDIVPVSQHRCTSASNCIRSSICARKSFNASQISPSCSQTQERKYKKREAAASNRLGEEVLCEYLEASARPGQSVASRRSKLRAATPLEKNSCNKIATPCGDASSRYTR